MIVARLRHVLDARRARWEALCRHCGLCCYVKEIRGFSAAPNYSRPCRFLNEKTRLCTVYKRRFEVCRECRRMTLYHAFFVRWLPDACGYVRRFRFLGTAHVAKSGREG